MKIETRFGLGQKVWIFSTTPQVNYQACSVCDGDGRVLVPRMTEKIGCPSCRGRGTEENTAVRWIKYETRELTIGMVRAIRATVPNLGADLDHHNHDEYMCEETGVGSGRVYHGHKVFATEAEASDAAESTGARSTRPEPAEAGV